MKFFGAVILLVALAGLSIQSEKLQATYFQAIRNVRGRQAQALAAQKASKKIKMAVKVKHMFNRKATKGALANTRRHLHKRRLAGSTFYGIRPNHVFKNQRKTVAVVKRGNKMI